jgi:hypothetical protein
VKTIRELSVSRVPNLRESFWNIQELEPPEKSSEPPRSATDTPTNNHTQAKHQYDQK